MGKPWKQKAESRESLIPTIRRAASEAGISQTTAEKFLHGTAHIEGQALSAFIAAVGGQTAFEKLSHDFRIC
jgi:hypothetical protein